jgi:hypothetical protein
MILTQDMPKLQSPFVRVEDGDEKLVVPIIAPGLEWVFEPDVIATEKLDGENVSVLIEAGKITRIFNRANEVPFFNKPKAQLVHAVVSAYARGYMDGLSDGQHFGEAIGPDILGNRYKLPQPIWLPFNTYCRKNLRYQSWGRYPKDFPTIEAWFKEGLHSLYYSRIHQDEKILAEGVVFHHPDGRMAKLRRDMYGWYEGPRHKRWRKQPKS